MFKNNAKKDGKTLAAEGSRDDDEELSPKQKAQARADHEIHAKQEAQRKEIDPSLAAEDEKENDPFGDMDEVKEKPRSRILPAPSSCRMVCYGTKPFAAVVTSVNEDGTANLAIFNDENNGVQFVHNVEQSQSPCAKMWHWPSRT